MFSWKKLCAWSVESNWYSRTSTTLDPPDAIQHCTAPLVKLYCCSMSLRAFGSLLSSDAWSSDRFRSVPSGFGQLREPLGGSTRKVRRSPVCSAGVGLAGARALGPADDPEPPAPEALGWPLLPVSHSAAPMPPPTSTRTRTTISTMAP